MATPDGALSVSINFWFHGFNASASGGDFKHLSPFMQLSVCASSFWHAHQRGLTQPADSSPALNPGRAALQPAAFWGWEASLSRRDLPTRAHPSMQGHGQTVLRWLWAVPTCHQLAWCHGHLHLHSCAHSQGASPGARTARGSQQRNTHGTGASLGQGLPLRQIDCCQQFFILMGNAGFSGSLLPIGEVSVTPFISQRGNTESEMSSRDSRYTSCVCLF